MNLQHGRVEGALDQEEIVYTRDKGKRWDAVDQNDEDFPVIIRGNNNSINKRKFKKFKIKL